MSTIDLLNRLRRAGIAVTAVGDHLSVDAPQGSLTAALRDELVQRKAELLAFLREARPDSAASVFAIERLPPDAEFPLSHAQQRLWFLEQLSPQGAAYVMAMATNLQGNLDVEALRRALTAIVARHEALRTVFAARDGVPFQRIVPADTIAVPLVDCRGYSPAEREATLAEAVRRNSRDPFDLEKGPLLRARLLRLADAEWLLLLAVHHIVFDAWSGGLFLAELANFYAAERDGSGATAPPLALRYVDFVAAQRRWLEQGSSEALLTYWRSQLDGNLEPLRLPSDGDKPSGNAGVVTRRIGPATTQALRTHAMNRRASLSMALLALFDVLLQRLTGQSDIIVGTPVAGRNHPATEQLVGYFINTLVLRTEVDGRQTFVDLVDRVRATTLAAYAHQEMPFDAIVNALGIERGTARTPIFQVFFNHLSMDLPPLELAGLATSPFGDPVLESKFDLTLYVREVRDEIELLAAFDDGLFDRASVDAWLAGFVALAEQIARDPARCVMEYTLVTESGVAPQPDGRAPLVQTTEPLGTLALPELGRFGARLALHGADAAWTYAELDDRANRLAGELLRRGLRRGDVVALYALRDPLLVCAMVAVARAGAVFTVLDPAYPDARLAECWRAAGCSWLLQVGAAAVLPNALAALAATVPTLAVTLSALSGFAPGATLPNVAASDPAYVAFTSGTTGGVKAVTGLHGPVAHFLKWQHRTFGLGAEDRFVALSGLAHDPLLRDIFSPLAIGAELHIPDGSLLDNPAAIGNWFAERRISVVHLTPAMAEWLAGIEQPMALRDVRLACFGGDVLTAPTLRRWMAAAPNARNVNFYGTTETPQAMAFHVVEPADVASNRGVPLGRGIDGVQLLVINAAGNPAGIGEIGEIVVRTPYLTLGYRGDEALTRQRFVANPCTGDASDRAYRTGDLGRYRPNGDVEFAGRRDDQIKLRGFRIELGEVEAALKGHPAVQDVAVAVVGERLVAYVVGAVTPDDCRDYVRRRLPAHMVPSHYHALTSLPRTPNNKIDRRALIGLQVAEATRHEYVAPRSANEATLAAIWVDVLRVPRVGATDNFFDIGGHSLLATRVLSRVNSTFGVRLRVRDVFAMPTLAEFARHIETVQWISHGAPAELLDSAVELDEESF